MRRSRVPVRTARLLLAPLLLLASAESTTDDLLRKGWDAQAHGRYLDALALDRQAAFGTDCKAHDALALDVVRQFATFVNPEPVADPGAKPDWQVSDAEMAAIGQATARDALDEIAARAARTRVTILNEDHAVPRSRAFAYQVAKRLRPLGYDVLAAETFDNLPDVAAADTAMRKLMSDGYPRQSTGAYTADPVFASFVRGALALGYRPANYETTAQTVSKDPAVQIAAREESEANYLVDRVLARNPGSKILIYVGFHHAAEAPIVRDGKSTSWMATRLKLKTGIDPLTIDQTTFMPAPTSVPSRPIYPLAASKAQGRSIVLMTGDTPLVIGEYAGVVDLQVVHPALPPIDGRPGWLADLDRKPVRVPERLRPGSGSALIQAFALNDAVDAVPLDQVMWDHDAPAPALMLPAGPVRYAVQTAPPPVCPGRDI